MSLLATAGDLEARLGLDLTVEETTRAETLLGLASDLIRRETGQQISLVADDSLVRRGTSSDRLRLPQRPVVSVASVSVAGQAVPSEQWYVSGDELVRRRGAWGDADDEVVVVYDHGYAAGQIPAEARAICLEAVVRVWVNPGAVNQEGYGSEQVTYPSRYTNRGSEVGGLLILRAEAEILRSALGCGVGTVVLR